MSPEAVVPREFYCSSGKLKHRRVPGENGETNRGHCAAWFCEARRNFIRAPLYMPVVLIWLRNSTRQADCGAHHARTLDCRPASTTHSTVYVTRRKSSNADRFRRGDCPDSPVEHAAFRSEIVRNRGSEEGNHVSIWHFSRTVRMISGEAQVSLRLVFQS